MSVGAGKTDEEIPRATGAFNYQAYGGDIHFEAGTNTRKYVTVGFNASRVARTGTMTHGKQLGVNFIIKY